MKNEIIPYFFTSLYERIYLMKILNRLFHFDERGAKLSNEIIGGIITFIAMCYILPVNASILSSPAMGMDSAGVFAMTAIVSCIVTLIMGLVANYPIALSAGMGLNAYLAFTLSSNLGFTSWQQKMIIVTISGIIFFFFSLTPVRKIIIESIPKDLKNIISAALGVFIAFVGLKGSGIIVSDESTLVSLGSFLDPGMLIAFICLLVCFFLMMTKRKMLSSLAIPISILLAAILGIITSSILISNGGLVNENGWMYTSDNLSNLQMNLPIAPWHSKDLSWGASGVEKVFFFGLATDSYSLSDFGKDLTLVFKTPASYIAVFSLCFVNLFDTTATLLAVGESTGIIDENGKMKNYRRAVLADASGALICGPLGTSTVTSFVESNVGVSVGAKTGLSACITALLFLLSAFIYPVFSIFTAGSVTSSALICVGAMIFVSHLKDLNWKDPVIGFTAFATVLFALLTYSISDGIGLGLIIYVVMMFACKRYKEVKPPIYCVTGFFLLAFLLQAVLPVITNKAT